MMNNLLHRKSSPHQRLYRLGTRRLTRAHLAMGQRPTFRAGAAQALQAICAALTRQLGCPVTGQSRVVASEVLPSRTLSESSAFALLDVSPCDARVLVELERGFVAALLGHLSGSAVAIPPAQTLTRIEQVAFGYLVLVCLEACRGGEDLEQRFGPRLLAVIDAREDALSRVDGRKPHVCVEVVLSAGPLTGLARVLVPALALQASLQDLPCEPAPAPAPEVLAAQLPMTATMGKIQLGLNELVALSPGDVAVFDAVKLSQGLVQGPCRLIGPAFEISGDLSPAGFTVVRAMSRALPQESSMSAPNPPEAKPVEATLTSLPVDVEVELTRLKLTLADLGSLRPGAILPLRINAADPVLLRVGDRAVARAELVEIENEVGARILNLLPER
jgi:type III secretion protein Q